MHNKVNLVVMMMMMKLLNKGNFFFLSGFSFTNIHDSQDSRGRGRLSIWLLSTTSASSRTLRHQSGDCYGELTSASSWQPDSSREPLVSERKSLTTKLHALKSRNNLKNKNNSDPESVAVKKHFNLCLFMKKNRVLNIIAVLVMILLILA